MKTRPPQRLFRRGALLAILPAALTLLVLLAPAGASAAGVVNCAPYGSGTATDVQVAAASGGTVTINGVCHGTVHLSNSVTLRGGTSGASSGLDGSGTGPVVRIDGGGTVTLLNLLVTGGSCTCQGAGVNVDNTPLNVVGSRVLGNVASSFGGGIYAQTSPVAVSNSTISGNTAKYDGGGLMMNGGSNLTVTGSTVSGNSAHSGGTGGGIYQGGNQLTVSSSTISGNHIEGSGGGIGGTEATVSLSRTTVTNNTADFGGGGIFYADGNAGGANGLTIASSSIDHNSANDEGGGLLNLSFYGSSSVSASNTTFAFNNAPFGGGVNNSGQGATASFSATSSSFIGNRALHGEGGAIFNEGIYSFSSALITLSQSTVGPTSGSTNGNQAEEGGGIYNFVYPGSGANVQVTLQNGTTVAHNTAFDTAGGVFNCAAGVLSLQSGGRVVMNTPNNVVTQSC